MNLIAQDLHKKIQNHTAKVGIIGLGYVGLPLALAFTESGFPVIGFDVDDTKIEKLDHGQSYIKHLDKDRIAAMAAGNLFEATTDFSRLAAADAVLICVPTPLTPQREPDMRYVEASARQIHRYLRDGQLIVLESTTYPGTTDELLKDILESEPEQVAGGHEHGSASFNIQNSKFNIKKCGTHFFLAFSPEREDPGNPDYGTTNTPKIVGGVDQVSGDLAVALYDHVIDQVVHVSSARVAEASKLTENIFRAVNIALVNELKVVYDRMGIDIWEVLDAAETKPFGFTRFNPGPGWGGHCIPLDPFYLAWKAREYGQPTRFIELAGEVNVAMPRYVVARLQDALNDRGKALKNSKILILGLAYKRDIDDPRESPAFELIEQLIDHGAEINYHDPHIPTAPPMRSWPDLPPMQSVDLNGSLKSFDAVVVVTDHSTIDWELVERDAPLIIDTRGVYRGEHEHVIKA